MRFTHLAASLLAISAMAQSDDRPKAIALVKDAVSVLKKGGKDTLVREIQQGRLHTKDENALYVFVYSPDGTCVAHGFKTIFVGTNRMNIKDPDGKAYIKDAIELAKTKGKGWVDYKYINPLTNLVQKKSTYVEFAEGLVFCCGVYLK
jgi:signal transduction histidine kinase